MIKRNIKEELLAQVREFPIVTVLGPRQAGKTTLVQSLKGYKYFNLEDPETRSFALEDPKAFLKPFKTKKVILDEIQRTPELLSYIQVLTDKMNINGHFILTGSHQADLQKSISQSLAGRTGILTLLPLSISELKTNKIKYEEPSEYIFKGFLPRVYDQNQRPHSAYSAYYKTYIERDLRQIINIKDISLFESFIKLLAGRVGQLMDYSDLSNSVGVSSVTIKNWLSLLESSFIIYKLKPYFENFNKRIIKSPKYYFTEPGLLNYLLQIQKQDQIQRDPLYGQIFENLVIVECLKHQYNKGLDPNLYFYRDSNKNEVDLFFKKDGQYCSVEIKSSSTYHSSFKKNLTQMAKHIKIKESYIIYNGKNQSLGDNLKLLNFKDSCKVL